MALINSVISWIIKKRIHQIELFIKYPVDVQNDLLIKLINEAKDTEWGKKYDYNNIRTYEDYRYRVPVNSYEDMKPYIDRLINGEQYLLWSEKIKWFASIVLFFLYLLKLQPSKGCKLLVFRWNVTKGLLGK